MVTRKNLKKKYGATYKHRHDRVKSAGATHPQATLLRTPHWSQFIAKCQCQRLRKSGPHRETRRNTRSHTVQRIEPTPDRVNLSPTPVGAFNYTPLLFALCFFFFASSLYTPRFVHPSDATVYLWGIYSLFVCIPE